MKQPTQHLQRAQIQIAGEVHLGAGFVGLDIDPETTMGGAAV